MFDFDDNHEINIEELSDPIVLRDQESPESFKNSHADENIGEITDESIEEITNENIEESEKRVVLSLDESSSEEDLSGEDSDLVASDVDSLIQDQGKINLEDEEFNDIASRKREERLKDISNILRTPSGLTNLIDEPAFKRSGVDLEETPHSSDIDVSDQSLSTDDDAVHLKQNNSFLHDNVD